MADKLGLGNEVRELKIGQSFTNPKATGSGFHTVRYDFKPASVDTNKIATVDVGNNHQVTVTVPHLDGAGVVFKGSQKPYQKECVLIIDKVTGEITLEKLACNIQVKKTRSESTKLPLPQDRLSQGSNDRLGGTSSNLSSRSQTPPMVGQRVSVKTKVTSGSRRPDKPITHLVPKHSPLHASPSYPSPSAHLNNKSPKNSSNNSNEFHTQSTLSSLPLIGDDFIEPPHHSSSSYHHNHHHTSSSSHSSLANNNHQQYNSTTTTNTNNNNNHHILEKSPNLIRHNSDTENGVGEMSDTSSSSSDSDSDSDHAEATIIEKTISKSNGHATTNGMQHTSNSNSFNKMAMPTHLLNEDLCLSESGSDSD